MVPIRYSADFPPVIAQVCLAAALLHRISPLRALAMAIAQCGGAIAAAALVLAITGIARYCLCIWVAAIDCGCIVRDHFPGLQKTDISLEFMLSFLAILVQLATEHPSAQTRRATVYRPTQKSREASCCSFPSPQCPGLRLGPNGLHRGG